MLNTRALIIRIDGADAIVQAAQGGGCGHCTSAGGCSSGKLSKLFCAKPRYFRVPNSIGAHIGDEVQISVADGVLLRSSLIMYMLPLACLLTGGLLGTWAADTPVQHDLYAATGAMLGLVTGFILSRLAARRQSPSSMRPMMAQCDDMLSPS